LHDFGSRYDVRVVVAALVMSLAVHGAVIVWMWASVRPPAAAAASPVVPPAAPPPLAVEAMSVEIVAASPKSPDGGVIGTIAAQRAPYGSAGRVAIATADGSPRETAALGTRGADVMKMRGNELPSTGLSAAFIASFLERSKPVPPKDSAAERLADDLAHDREALRNPRWLANALPAQVGAMRQKLVDDLDRRDHEELRPAGGGRFKSEHTVHDMNGLKRESFGVDVATDGTIKFHDPRNLQARGLAGSFDLNDWAMRSHGDDPYAHDKLDWLDKTRDDRVAIGKHHQREVLAHTPRYVQQNLALAWRRGRDMTARKRDLFDLWDECAEWGDDALVSAGATARSYVIGFIRAKLPADSPDAYNAGELAELNQHRQSKQVFAPYTE
jgi:hypothetical protein